MPTPPRYAYTRLLVREFAACFRFYRDVLGLEPGFGDEHSGYADFQTGDVTLALFDRQEMAEAIGAAALPRTALAQDNVALVLLVDDTDEAAASLRAKGVSFVKEPHDRRDWGGRVAHFRDPDGTLLELFQSLPQEE